MAHAPHLSLLVAVIVLLNAAGCTSLYRATLHEMSQTPPEVLAQRTADLRDECVTARRAFAQSIEQLAAMDAGDGCSDRSALEQAINRAELAAWNMQRKMLSLRDVGDDYMQQVASQAHTHADRATSRSLERAYQYALHRATGAEHAMQRMLEGLQHHKAMATMAAMGAMADHAGEPSVQVRMLRPVAAPRAEAALLTAQLDEAIRAAELLMNKLQ